jgi:aspartyl-tRNA(Asn)/glutamyl-tRNA(Gln) amidotransferase subunit A
MCDAALGTQTGGSLLRPASFCGVYVVKPSKGRWPVAGVRELALSLDHVGAMASSLEVLTRISDAIDFREWEPDPGPPRFTLLSPPWLDRMGPEMRQTFDLSIKTLEATGAALTHHAGPEGIDSIHGLYATLLSAEAAHSHQRAWNDRPDLYPPKIRELCEAGESVLAIDYLAAQATGWPIRSEIFEIIKSHGPILFPAATGPAPGPSTTGDPIFNSPWSYLGLPVIGLPLQVADGEMPLGLQVIGAFHNDDSLLSVARWLDRALRPPL